MDIAGSQRTSAINLPLAPMADVFIVVLILILKTLTFEASSNPVGTDVQLPGAKAAEGTPGNLQVMVGANAVRLNDEEILPLSNYEFPSGTLDTAGFSPAFRSALSAGEGEAAQKTLTVYADKNAPYATVRALLQTAMSAGITKIRIAVAQE